MRAIRCRADTRWDNRSFTSGKDAYRSILSAKPSVKVLFTSGYSIETLDRKSMLVEGPSLLLKPISPTDLLSAVRKALDA